MQKHNYPSLESSDKFQSEHCGKHGTPEYKEKYVPFGQYSGLIEKAKELQDKDIRRTALKKVEEDLSSNATEEERIEGVPILRAYEMAEALGIERKFVEEVYNQSHFITQRMSEEEQLALIEKYNPKSSSNIKEYLEKQTERKRFRRSIDNLIRENFSEELGFSYKSFFNPYHFDYYLDFTSKSEKQKKKSFLERVLRRILKINPTYPEKTKRVAEFSEDDKGLMKILIDDINFLKLFDDKNMKQKVQELGVNCEVILSWELSESIKSSMDSLKLGL